MSKKAISAQNTKMYLENLTSAPIATGEITDASKSAPCYVEFDDVSKLKNGIPIYVSGTGWTSIDNQEWILQNIDVDAKTAALYNSDTTTETTDVSDGPGAMYQVNAFDDVCARTYTINQTPATSIDTTTLCDAEKTSLVGFRDPGTLTFDFFIDPTDPAYLALLEAYDDGDERQFEIIYRNGAVRTLPVVVQSINETGGVDQAIAGSATLKIVGQPILTQPVSVQPPAYAVDVNLTPTSGTAPLAVTLTLTEQNGTASKFVVTWGDGTADDTMTTGTLTKGHTYDTAGAYTPGVVATVFGITKPAVQGDAVTVS
ncbi:Phage major tail protein 2 [Caballeronia calidae]|uniref:Phage major tail protein 2 n=1 Tax=Caballeronia calidae TaxID=1777139 RepID=A0A158E9M3_9BURK|nr:phage tail tube protein [Caballeronia calidae]SAL03086.1 Phage major tail protein 2 [Caballeronia calidae]